ncbi:MAG: mechanosensitive ion channel family protein [Acidobacteriota bacterium]
MEYFGFKVTWQDFDQWLETARSFVLPRLGESLALVVAAAILYILARWFLRRFQQHLTSRTVTDLDDCIVCAARRCILLSIAFWTVWRLAQTWDLGSTTTLVAAVWAFSFSIPLTRLVIDLIEILEKRFVPKTATRMDDTALPLLNKFVQFLGTGIGVMVGLQIMGIPITPFLGGAGVAGLALSFAAKDTLSNLIAGVLLILDRPFQVGDRIEIWNAPKDSASWGDIVEIGLRATKIRTTDNIIIVIPNNEIMRRDIINYTASGEDIRLRIPIGIAYDADARLAKKLILQMADQIDGIKKKPAPVVITRRFGASAVDLEVRVWILNARKRRAIADELTDRVKDLFDRNGVEIPFPKRDLYIRSMPPPSSLAETLPASSNRTDEPGKSRDDPAA